MSNSSDTKGPDVLIIEDTMSLALSHQRHLARVGIKADISQKGANAIGLLATGQFSVALLDLDLPDMNGLDVMKALRSKKHDITYIVVTANASINTAITAMKKGAYDYLVKPVSAQRLITSVNNALERKALKEKVNVLKQDLPKARDENFIGSSPAMLAVFKMIESIAATKAPVFITGESGTGKEVCAQAIHDASPRSGGAFYAINCAALPDNLIESEIFGHVKGAFTGASETRRGAARQAHGGTLFLDEICEMDITLQAKLLRFLQTGQIRSVGSDKTEEVDVRILCATNRNPRLEVAEGRFREDLFYRLDVLSLDLPPLRARAGDVIELAQSFMETYSQEEGKDFAEIDDEARLAIKQYGWPGNVRELQNIMRKVVIMNSGTVVTRGMVQQALGARNGGLDIGDSSYELIGLTRSRTANNGPSMNLNINRSMAEIEEDIINSVIENVGGSVPKASEILKLSPSTIYRKRESWAELKKSNS